MYVSASKARNQGRVHGKWMATCELIANVKKKNKKWKGCELATLLHTPHEYEKI